MNRPADSRNGSQYQSLLNKEGAKRTTVMDAKGTVLISVQEFVLAYFGGEGFVKWISSLDSVTAELYRSKISPKAWFPLQRTLNKPTEAFCNLFFGGDPKGAWECGRYSADLAATRFLRLFVRMASVNILLKRASDILPMYYKPCRLVVSENESDSAALQVVQFPQIDEFIEHRIGGWIQRAVEISGKPKVNVEITRSLTRGDSVTEYHIDWK